MNKLLLILTLMNLGRTALDTALEQPDSVLYNISRAGVVKLLRANGELFIDFLHYISTIIFFLAPFIDHQPCRTLTCIDLSMWGSSNSHIFKESFIASPNNLMSIV